jgi:peroxiredoxin
LSVNMTTIPSFTQRSPEFHIDIIMVTSINWVMVMKNWLRNRRGPY